MPWAVVAGGGLWHLPARPPSPKYPCFSRVGQSVGVDIRFESAAKRVASCTLFSSVLLLPKAPVGATSACTKCDTSPGPGDSVPGQLVTRA